ncbi:nucleoside kinase [Hoylesella timonensis]|uniref:nucleoside kinase n=1 Tax=Hoylesella timonensis TaxID=386414 RepID=UPI00336AD5F2
MKQMLHIRCKNNKKIKDVAIGSTLSEVFDEFKLEMSFGPICARVNNKVCGMNLCLYHNKDVEFLDMYNSSAQRNYTRTLFFILCKAVHDLYAGSEVVIDIPVSNGYYINLKIGHEVSEEDAVRIRERMQQIIDAKIPIVRYQVPTEDAIEMFEHKGDEAKVKLLRSIGSLYTVYHQIDDYVDYYYGSLLPNTGDIYLFGLEKYYEGLLLRIPSKENPAKLGELIRQDKMFEVFLEQHRRQHILGVSTVGDFNEAVQQGHATDMINISEALQEKKISQIADSIAMHPDVRMVLIAGPSSSGKTTFCKRLSIQLLANGIRPVQISLDDYFVDRHRTPLDSNGDFDYESLYALDIQLINEQFSALFRGDEVELPKYNFLTGKSEKSGKKMRLEERQVLVVEGIHALNPELTAQIPDEQKFKVYISALTTILLDDHNYIPTTDNRLLRRIIRDNKYRGVSAQETIKRWPSVRAGETKWIFPYQENADIMFNTAMLYELAVIKSQAVPLLEQVPENCEEYAEAYRLRKFLAYIKPISHRDLPPTSLIREFLGGSSFRY